MNREEKKRETRKRIMEAAVKLFSDQGYDSTTVAQITEKAGVGKGTFFNYFNSKEEIMCDLQGFWAVDEIMKLREHHGPYVPVIKELMMELIRRMQLNRPLANAMLTGMLSSPINLANQNDILQSVYEAAAPVIRLAQDRGELSRALSPQAIVEQIVQSFFGSMLFWCMEQGEEQLEAQMRVTMEVTLAGLAPQEEI
ncbi:TetR/AcrR family transcriptional regulator [Paenibacillus koleovorans]|uniref:TetR/AcrR family transcriptional regulator n=1 Tax=Paenibacillus koleovorans TaxID=121608 RepID=UPI000FDA54CE|nr:TetR/AcrR family transcriptional regulator [Paenibacillus koleovorans]